MKVYSNYYWVILKCYKVTLVQRDDMLILITYNSITVNSCIKQCIPLHRHSKRSIVGWNDEVKHYYGMARSEFKYWKQNGIPRSFPIYREMSSARARFKYALRQCRLDELTISSTKLADSMNNHDVDSFWKDIRERNKSKSSMSNCIECTFVLLGKLTLLSFEEITTEVC